MADTNTRCKPKVLISPQSVTWGAEIEATPTLKQVSQVSYKASVNAGQISPVGRTCVVQCKRLDFHSSDIRVFAYVFTDEM